MNVTIRTNNVPRDTVEAHELTAKERAEFDYLDWPAIEAGDASATFMRFKGQVYDLGEFMRCPDTAWFKGWDGYHSDSAFSGVLVRYVDNFERVIVAQYFS